MLAGRLWQTASQGCEGGLPRSKNATCWTRASRRWRKLARNLQSRASLMELWVLEASRCATFCARGGDWRGTALPVGIRLAVQVQLISLSLGPHSILFPLCNNIRSFGAREWRAENGSLGPVQRLEDGNKTQLPSCLACCNLVNPTGSTGALDHGSFKPLRYSHLLLLSWHRTQVILHENCLKLPVWWKGIRNF